MSPESRADAHDAFRDLPDRPSLRHLKLEAKRRLAAGEFTTLHDAQLAIAREHGISSWTKLKQHVSAAGSGSGSGPALAQVRWVLGRYAGAGAPDWEPPAREELSAHFTESYLAVVPPETMAEALRRVAPRLGQDLVIADSGPHRLRARVADLHVEAATETTAPHRITSLRVYPGAGTITDARVASPPAASSGLVPAAVPGLTASSYADLGLVGVIVAGDWGDGPASGGWSHSRGWASLEDDAALAPDAPFPVRAITKLVTATAVLRLVADGAVALDDPANRHLRAMRLADDEITVRELLAHAGGVDSPASAWADSAADPVAVLGTVAACSGTRGEFAYSDGGYAVLGQLIADLTGSGFAEAVSRLVLAPLAMADSWFPVRFPDAAGPLRGYRLAQDGTFAAEPLPMFTLQAAGGLWSTGPDLVRFGAGWAGLLPGALAGEALRPQARRSAAGAEIGLGWLLQHPKDIVGHAGSGPGASVSLMLRPSTGRTSVVLANRLLSIEPVNVRMIRPAG